MTDLRETIFNYIIDVIDVWDEKDIYAICFFIYNRRSDVTKPMLLVDYNTISNYKLQLTCPWWEPVEARWNYKCWIQNDKYNFGTEKDDDTIRQWIAENELKNSNITKEFIDVTIQIAIELHNSKILEQKFGKPLPIVFQDFKYSDAIAEQTKQANPNGEADEFVNWIMDIKKWEVDIE